MRTREFLSALKTVIASDEDITDGHRYIVIKARVNDQRKKIEDAYCVTAHTTEYGTVEFDLGDGPIEFYTEKPEVFETNAPFDGCTLRVFPRYSETEALYDEVKHLNAARRIRREIAKVVAGLSEETARGELDDVRTLQSLASDLVFHEAALNQDTVPSREDRGFGPLVVLPS